MAKTILQPLATSRIPTMAAVALALLAELEAVRQRLALVSAHDAEVTAACRAGLAGVRDGELDPWSYPRGVLEEYGQLPRDDQHPAELLALGYRCGSGMSGDATFGWGTGPRQCEAVFEGQAAAVRQARWFVRTVLAEVGGLPEVLVEDALTSVSELATNAIRHTASGRPGGTFTVRIEVTDGHVHVEVIDQGGATAPQVQVGADRADRVSGRGLWILTQLGVLTVAPAPGGLPGHRVGLLLARPATVPAVSAGSGVEGVA